MNTKPKTDECIKMLGEVQMVFAPLHYNSNAFSHEEGATRIIDYQNRIMAMLDYRLLPFRVITIPDNENKETVRANSIIKKCVNDNDFDAFWYAMKNYQLVTADDLKNEFWSICPDLERMPKFLDTWIVKFDDVNYNYDTDINTIKEQYNGLNEAVKEGIISEKEADTIFWNIHFISFRYNFIMECIREIYRKFRKMTEPQQTDTSTGEPQQNIILETILQALEQKDCITQNPLKWLKEKNLLAYFVVGMCEKYKIKHGQKRKLKPFEKIFGVSGLSGTINDMKKTGKQPADYEIINEILKLSKNFFNDNFLNGK